MKLLMLCGCVVALALGGGCSWFLGPDSSGAQVVAQAKAGDQIAFDVVKISDAVVETLKAQQQPAFRQRFKKYVPPQEQKIAVGDTVSIVIWEASSQGLFGLSLRESLPATGGRLGKSGTAPTGYSSAGGMETTRTRTAQPTPDNPAKQQTAASGGDQTRQAVRSGTSQPTTEQTGRPGAIIPDQQVGTDGAISIPYAGRIPAAGRTPGEVQQTVEQRLKSKALDPQALVIVQSSPVNSVTVSGEAVAGGRVTLPPGGLKLLAVIAAAGGARTPVHDAYVRLSRDGVTATVPLATLVGDPDQDIFARPGDVLTVTRLPRSFTVFGTTGKNTAIEFNRDRLSLSEAVGQAGGLLDDRSDPRAVFLFRYEPVSTVRALGQPIATRAPEGVSPIAYRLDLSDARSYLLAQQFAMRDKDIIFVAAAESEPIYRFVRVLSTIAGPITTGLLVCQSSNC